MFFLNLSQLTHISLCQQIRILFPSTLTRWGGQTMSKLILCCIGETSCYSRKIPHKFIAWRSDWFRIKEKGSKRRTWLKGKWKSEVKISMTPATIRVMWNLMQISNVPIAIISDESKKMSITFSSVLTPTAAVICSGLPSAWKMQSTFSERSRS